MLQERNPFNMLPPPLNLFPILVTPFHFAYLWWMSLGSAADPSAVEVCTHVYMHVYMYV
jgi:hypothetical protein